LNEVQERLDKLERTMQSVQARKVQAMYSAGGMESLPMDRLGDAKHLKGGMMLEKRRDGMEGSIAAKGKVCQRWNAKQTHNVCPLRHSEIQFGEVKGLEG
jgi:hypothetical protein